MQARSLDLTETTPLVRLALKRAFPGVKFSVRSSRFAGGTSISIGWEDGPSWEDVDAVAQRYRSGTFNGSDDSYRDRGACWLRTDGSVADTDEPGAEPVYFGAAYVSCTRRIGAVQTARLKELVEELTGAPFSESRRYEIAYGGRMHEGYGSQVLHTLDQAVNAQEQDGAEAVAAEEEQAQAADDPWARLYRQVLSWDDLTPESVTNEQYYQASRIVEGLMAARARRDDLQEQEAVVTPADPIEVEEYDAAPEVLAHPAVSIRLVLNRAGRPLDTGALVQGDELWTLANIILQTWAQDAPDVGHDLVSVTVLFADEMVFHVPFELRRANVLGADLVAALHEFAERLENAAPTLLHRAAITQFRQLHRFGED